MTRTRRALTGAVVPLMMAGAVQVVGPAPAHASGASAPVALELLPGLTGGEATAVNAAGVIVGYENTDVNNAGLIVGSDAQYRPVTWTLTGP